MSKVTRENYLMIQGWMVTDLKLKGNDLLVYAIIYGRTQGVFECSLPIQYFTEYTGTTENTIKNCMSRLQEKNLIYIKNLGSSYIFSTQPITTGTTKIKSKKKTDKERKSYKYMKFRKQVLERDGYKCVICGKKHGLDVHHIKTYAKHPELRTITENGVTLCKECHRKEHKENGYL